MNGGMIRFLVYAVTMCVIYFVLEYLNTRDNISKDPTQSDAIYIVRMPSALKVTYGVMFGLGMFLLIFWGFLRLRNVPEVTDGHLWFAVVFAAIGLFVVILASKWRITVQGDQMSIHRLFHKPQTVSFSNIERAEEQTKKTKMGISSRLVLYKDGKRLITVDGLSDNYDRFFKTLKRYGKLREDAEGTNKKK